MTPLTFTILGEPVSMKNSRRILRNRKTGKPFSAKSSAAAKYARDALLQIPQLPPYQLVFFHGPVSFTATLFYKDARKDLDAELIIDLLQGRVILNDRQVVEKHLFRKIDKLNPRAVVTVEVL